MLQNYIQKEPLKKFKNKTQNIDKIVEWALEKEGSRINDKYNHISNHVKILKNLMTEFAKKADNLQKNLLAVARVEETQFQSKYYQKTIEECLESSENLKVQIEEKNKKIEITQKRTNQLKRSLLKLKTQNIKILMKMQQIQENAQMQQHKQNIEKQKVQRILKSQISRSYIVKSSEVPPLQNSLKEQSLNLQLSLLAKIDQANQLKLFIENCFSVLREKLKKQEKKSNLYGLAGSMLFKLETKPAPIRALGKKPSDAKLIIYDVLRQKYKKHIKQQTKKQEELKIDFVDFMKFSPLQIMGVIELKGGLQNILSKKINFKDNVKQFSTNQSDIHC